jgi:hypothetical protein
MPPDPWLLGAWSARSWLHAPGTLSSRPVQLSRLTRKRDPNRERRFVFVSCIALRKNVFWDMQRRSVGKTETKQHGIWQSRNPRYLLYAPYLAPYSHRSYR